MSKPRKLPKGSEKTIVFNFFNFLNSPKVEYMRNLN